MAKVLLVVLLLTAPFIALCDWDRNAAAARAEARQARREAMRDAQRLHEDARRAAAEARENIREAVREAQRDLRHAQRDFDRAWRPREIGTRDQALSAPGMLQFTGAGKSQAWTGQ